MFFLLVTAIHVRPPAIIKRLLVQNTELFSVNNPSYVRRMYRTQWGAARILLCKIYWVFECVDQVSETELVTELSREETPVFQGFDCTRRPPLVSDQYLASWVEPSGGLDRI